MTKSKGALIVLAAAVATIALLWNPEYYIVSVVHLSAIPAFAYPIVYRNSPWRSGPTGRALFNKALSMALLFGIGILGFWWPFRGYDYIYGVVVTYLGVAITYQLLVMYRLKKAGQAQLAAPEGTPR